MASTTIELTDEEVNRFQEARAAFTHAQAQAMNTAAGFSSDALMVPAALVRTALLADTREQFRDVVSYAEEHRALDVEHLVTLFQVNQWIGKEAGAFIDRNLSAGLNAVQLGYATEDDVEELRHSAVGKLNAVRGHIQGLVDMVKSKLPAAEVLEYERVAKPTEGYIGM